MVLTYESERPVAAVLPQEELLSELLQRVEDYGDEAAETDLLAFFRQSRQRLVAGLIAWLNAMGERQKGKPIPRFQPDPGLRTLAAALRSHPTARARMAPLIQEAVRDTQQDRLLRSLTPKLLGGTANLELS